MSDSEARKEAKRVSARRRYWAKKGIKATSRAEARRERTLNALTARHPTEPEYKPRVIPPEDRLNTYMFPMFHRSGEGTIMAYLHLPTSMDRSDVKRLKGMLDALCLEPPDGE